MRMGQFGRNKIISLEIARRRRGATAVVVALFSFVAVAGAWALPVHAQGFLTADTTQSRYEYGDDPVSLYAQGVADAQAGLQGAVILDFGRPAQDAAGVQSTLDFGSKVDALGNVASAVERYIDGYRHGAPATAKLTVFLGTNNSCGTGQPCGGSTCGCKVEPTNFATWGQTFGTAVAVVNDYASSSGTANTAAISVGGADDAEPGFDPGYTNTFNTLTGYAAVTKLPMADYGSLDGGPGHSYWTPAQLAAVAGGFGSDTPFPEIYHQSMADQWAALSNWSAINLSKPLTFSGILTDEAAPGSTTPVATPTPVLTPSPTSTPTPTPTVSVTPPVSSPPVSGTPTSTPTVTPTTSVTPSPSPTPVATDTPQQASDQLLGDLNTTYTTTHQAAIAWSSNINRAAVVANPVAFSRLGGADRESTAVAISQAEYPATGTAQAVVLARGDAYPDALSGGPLAAHLHAPLLLTDPKTLTPATASEIARVLPVGGTIYLLGGPAAITPAVQAALVALGYATQRVEGVDRYATAVAVADLLGDPPTTLLATGTNFPDALVAGDAAVTAGGAVLLTEGGKLPAATQAYLAAHPTGPTYALGGPAAAADPAATPLVGADRDQTAIVVAHQFDPTPTGLAISTDLNFPDAMSAAPLLGPLGYPLLLTPPNVVSNENGAYLSTTTTATKVDVLGLQAAIYDSTAYLALYQLGRTQ
jgi:ell wall binding domain 2 (CWB2)